MTVSDSSASDNRLPLDRIRADVRAMHAYAVQDARGFLKLDAMENPYGLPPALQTELGARLGALALNRYPGDRGADLQRGRQAVGVLHRVELEEAARVLHRVGVHGAHVGADAVERQAVVGSGRIGNGHRVQR